MSTSIPKNNLNGQNRLGDSIWSKMSKVNAELFTLTYGAMVAELIKDIEDVDMVNKQLEKMGHNIGIRLIDEFLAKSGVANCTSFKDTAEVIAKIAFKMFLGITAEVTNWNQEYSSFSLIISDNPLAEFVELPPKYNHLIYSNLYCGVIKGALEMVQLQVECSFVQDVLRGDETNEIRVELKGLLSAQMSDDYKEN